MNSSTEEIPEPVLISTDSLNEETLTSVLESFILREGTDYGASELTLDQKISNIRKKIDKNEIVLVFDPSTESLTFLTAVEWQKLKN